VGKWENGTLLNESFMNITQWRKSWKSGSAMWLNIIRFNPERKITK
jgi:hypothetical protein